MAQVEQEACPYQGRRRQPGGSVNPKEEPELGSNENPFFMYYFKPFWEIHRTPQTYSVWKDYSSWRAPCSEWVCPSPPVPPAVLGLSESVYAPSVGSSVYVPRGLCIHDGELTGVFVKLRVSLSTCSG